VCPLDVIFSDLSHEAVALAGLAIAVPLDVIFSDPWIEAFTGTGRAVALVSAGLVASHDRNLRFAWPVPGLVWTVAVPVLWRKRLP
jgi:hypothetical protein